MKKVLILTAIALISAACGNTSTTEVKNTSNTTVTNTQAMVETPRESTFTSGANPREDIISATQKLQKMDSWSAKISSETALESNAEMEYIAPDRYHIKKTDGEIIVIGSDSYENQKGKWTKLDDNIGAVINSQTKAGIAEAIKNLKDVQIVGKEKFNGKDATVYMHKAGEVTTKIWIAADSGLQLKNEVEANIGGQLEKQTTVYDYDKKFKIEAPKID
jgi:hypothetical protein